MIIPTNKVKALTMFLEGKELVTIGTAKNANQDFSYIKNKGVELIERSVPNENNAQSSLYRSLKMTPENIQRAKKLLKHLMRYCKKCKTV